MELDSCRRELIERRTFASQSVTPASTSSLPTERSRIQSPLSGRVNVYNLLAAMCAALARGMTLEEIARATPTLKQVPGRFEIVPGCERAGFSVVVDYAHTDDALRNLIGLARENIGIHQRPRHHALRLRRRPRPHQASEDGPCRR